MLRPIPMMILAAGLFLLVPAAAKALTISGCIADCDGNPIPGVAGTIELFFVTNPAPIEFGPNGCFSFTHDCEEGEEFELFLTITFEDGRRPIELSGVTVECGQEFEVAFDCKEPPRYRQDGINNCGPATAAALVVWLRQLGYPGLRGDTNLGDLEDEIAEEADTSDTTGTDLHRLRDALRAIFDSPEACGTIRADLLRGPFPLADASGILGASAESPVIILLQQRGGTFAHYVLVYDASINDEGDTLTLKFMDTATGTLRELELTRDPESDDPFTGSYGTSSGSRNVHIDAGILISTKQPSTKAETETTPEGANKATYTLRIPENDAVDPPRDWHLMVGDCDESQYTVTVPDGYQWTIVQRGRQCFISVYPATPDAEPLADGAEIIVESSRGVEQRARAASFSFDGTSDPPTRTTPAQDAPTFVAACDPAPPPFASAPAASVLAFGGDPATAGLFLEFPQPDAFVDYTLVEGEGPDGVVLLEDAPGPIFELPFEFPEGVLRGIRVEQATCDGTLLPDPPLGNGPEWRMYRPEAVSWTPDLGPARFKVLGDCPTREGDCPDGGGVEVEPLFTTEDRAIELAVVDGAVPWPPIAAPGARPEARSHFIWTPQAIPPGPHRITLGASGFDADGEQLEGYEPRLFVFMEDGFDWIDVTEHGLGTRASGSVSGIVDLPATVAVVYIPGASVPDWEALD